MWLRLSKVSQCIVYCSYGNNNHLDTEEGKKSKGTATGNWTHYHKVPADIAGAYWKRAEVSTDIGGWTVGKGQLHLHLIHPPKAPVYYCNSLGAGLPSRLSRICQEKHSLKTTYFPTISFLLHSMSQCSWTVRWDHHYGRSDVGLFCLKGWRGAAFGPYQLRLTKAVMLKLLTLALPGCLGSQGSFCSLCQEKPMQTYGSNKRQKNVLGRALPAHAPQSMTMAGFATCLRVGFFPPGLHLLGLPLAELRWSISRWTHWMLSIMAGSFPNPLPKTYSG